MKIWSLAIPLLLVKILFFQILSANELQTKPKIAIVSLYDSSYLNIGKYSDENKQKYAQKHGYDVILYHETLDASRPTAWSKVLALQGHLKDYDWLYWSDADSLIMNPDIKLESFIDDNFDIVISKDCQKGSFNTGSFLIKNTEWSAQLLKEMYALTDFTNIHRWEQGAFVHLVKLSPERLSHVKSLTESALNATISNSAISFCQKPEHLYKIGDFILHFYGPGNKEMLMQEWSQRVDWNRIARTAPADELQKKPKIAIVSLYDAGYIKIGKCSDENKKKYAQKHGYDVILYHETLDASRPTAWSKILALQKHLKDYDWVYWSDADSLIMNPEIKLESFIDDRFDMIISTGCLSRVNTGSFLIKNSEWSAQLLKDIYTETTFIKHHNWEQEALIHLLKINTELLSHIQILHRRVLNSNILNPNNPCKQYPADLYKIGDFVLHFYGKCDKENLMIEWSSRINW